MNALLLFLGSFALIFLLTMQQHNVALRKQFGAAVTSAAIGIVTIANVRLGAQADFLEMLVFVLAQPIATVLSMWVCARRPVDQRDSRGVATAAAGRIFTKSIAKQ